MKIEFIIFTLFMISAGYVGSKAFYAPNSIAASLYITIAIILIICGITCIKDN